MLMCSWKTAFNVAHSLISCGGSQREIFRSLLTSLVILLSFCLIFYFFFISFACTCDVCVIPLYFHGNNLMWNMRLWPKEKQNMCSSNKNASQWSFFFFFFGCELLLRFFSFATQYSWRSVLSVSQKFSREKKSILYSLCQGILRVCDWMRCDV